MILRLFRSGVPVGAEAAHVARLRDHVIPRLRVTPGLVAWTHGFRTTPAALQALTMSCWSEYDAILAATKGDADRPVHDIPIDDIVEDVEIDHYELVEPFDSGIVDLDGAVIGMVRASVQPRSEALAQEMVRNIRPRVLDAGAMALEFGRRVSGNHTEIVMVAVWPERIALARWARSRPEGALDPNFLAILDAWSFETFDCIPPDELVRPGDGPAVLVVDESLKLIEASRGVEGVVGLPGEVLIGRSLPELLVSVDGRATDTPDVAATTAWLFARPETRGTLDLSLPASIEFTGCYRTAANQPSAGLHSLILTRPNSADETLPIERLIAMALPGSLALGPLPAA